MQYYLFKREATKRARDQTHRAKLLKVIGNYDSQVSNMKGTQFRDWQQARVLAASVKDFVLSRLANLLEQFERAMLGRGAVVLWAKNAEEARKHIEEITQLHSLKRVVKSKSMVCEEIELNKHLESMGLEVWESDLGELIVQLAGERPYHIVTPAMHKSKAEIAELFHKTLGIPLTEDVEGLVAAARNHLRDIFLEADCGITGANFLLAKEGAVHILENEGNAQFCCATPKVHIVLAGIEKVLPSMHELELFLPLLATSGTGQRLTTYNTLLRGPRREGETSGPESMYVILLDNGRSQLFRDPEFREALRCIRCGACLNACPVYKSIGGHSYNSAYPGPIGAAINPFLFGEEQAGHLAQASTLCGACADVCPVNIPLHHLILKNRFRNRIGFIWSVLFNFWSLFANCESRLRVVRPLLMLLANISAKVGHTPKFAAKSFRQYFKERRNG